MKYLSFLLPLMVLSLLTPLWASNALQGNASPYLALHGDDPVDWQEWSKAALDKARKEDKLIFVSVGYFACHWCHVMQRESFSDPEVAKILNQHFVSIKVDRELNPALDQRLMTFLQATAGRGGWPMNVFLTPDGHPLVGIVYRPKDSFLRLLNSLQERWKVEREGLQMAAEEVDQLLANAQNDEQQVVKGKKVADLAPRYRQDVMDLGDHLQGGFKGQTRFPYAPQLQAFLDLNARKPREDEQEFLRLTLDQMIHKGLRDHVGDGFFRYTVDPDWETPHYEKMLYTNAMLASLLLDAGKQLEKPEYTAAALGTLRFMMREMNAAGGAFVASLSAVDDHDVEGGYYRWTQAELKALLSEEDLALVNVGWGMQRLDGDEALLPIMTRSLPELQKDFDLDGEALARRFDKIRSALLSYREKNRVQPRDDKRLAGWNGLALSAFAKGVQEDPSLKPRGAQLAAFLSRSLWDGKSLQKAVDAQGRGLGAGAFEDYAYVAKGLIDWGLAAGDDKSVAAGEAVAASAWQRFYSPEGWLDVEETLLPKPLLQRHLRDQTLHSPEAVLIQATLRSPALSKSRGGEVERLLSQVTKSLLNDSFGYPGLIAVAAQREK